MQFVHDLESVMQDRFEEVCPWLRGEVRAIKPVLSPALGSVLPDPDRRQKCPWPLVEDNSMSHLEP